MPSSSSSSTAKTKSDDELQKIVEQSELLLKSDYARNFNLVLVNRNREVSFRRLKYNLGWSHQQYLLKIFLDCSKHSKICEAVLSGSQQNGSKNKKGCIHIPIYVLNLYVKISGKFLIAKKKLVNCCESSNIFTLYVALNSITQTKINLFIW